MSTQNKSIFHDQAEFMAAAGNTFPACRTEANIVLAKTLIDEEDKEFNDELRSFLEHDGVNLNDVKEALDKIYVTCQYLNTIIGPDMSLTCWNALQGNNMSKCIDGKLVKRADGKVRKPVGYKNLDLTPILGGAK